MTLLAQGSQGDAFLVPPSRTSEQLISFYDRCQGPNPLMKRMGRLSQTGRSQPPPMTKSLLWGVVAKSALQKALLALQGRRCGPEVAATLGEILALLRSLLGDLRQVA